MGDGAGPFGRSRNMRIEPDILASQQLEEENPDSESWSETETEGAARARAKGRGQELAGRGGKEYDDPVEPAAGTAWGFRCVGGSKAVVEEDVVRWLEQRMETVRTWAGGQAHLAPGLRRGVAYLALSARRLSAP